MGADTKQTGQGQTQDHKVQGQTQDHKQKQAGDLPETDPQRREAGDPPAREDTKAVKLQQG